MSGKKVRLAKSIISQQEVDSVVDLMLHNGYLGMGKEVQCFESEIKAFLSTD